MKVSNSLSQIREQNLEEEFQKAKNFCISFKHQKGKKSKRNSLASLVETTSDIVTDSEINPGNISKLSNRGILNNLNKFCSYNFIQTNNFIPYVCSSNDKNGHATNSKKQESKEYSEEYLKIVIILT